MAYLSRSKNQKELRNMNLPVITETI